MKIPIKNLLLFILLISFVACSDDDSDGTPTDDDVPTGNTVIDVASDDTNLSSFLSALESASGDLVNVLEGSGPFTIFAPDNDAFETFLDGRALTEIPSADLQQLLLNHVISADIPSNSLSSGYRSSLSTAGAGGNNLSLLVINDGDITINDSSTITTPDLSASNGTIHIIDAVIGLPTVNDIINKDPNLIEFANSLESFPPPTGTFADILSSDDDVITLFAPSNEASNNFNNPNGNDIPNVIFNHIMSGALTLADFTSTYELSSLATNEDGDNLSYFIDVDSNSPNVIVNGLTMGNADNKDIIATNGIVHIVEDIIDLPTILTLAEADPNLQGIIALLDLLTIPGADPDENTFRELLENGDSFTIFAPIDSEVQALADSQTDSDLVDILFHHVLEGNIRSEDLTNGLTSATVQGANLTFQLPGNGSSVASITDGAGNTGINLTITDIQTLDGVIHVIDSFLLPE